MSVFINHSPVIMLHVATLFRSTRSKVLKSTNVITFIISHNNCFSKNIYEHMAMKSGFGFLSLRSFQLGSPE